MTAPPPPFVGALRLSCFLNISSRTGNGDGKLLCCAKHVAPEVVAVGVKRGDTRASGSNLGSAKKGGVILQCRRVRLKTTRCVSKEEKCNLMNIPMALSIDIEKTFSRKTNSTTPRRYWVKISSPAVHKNKFEPKKTPPLVP